MSAEDTVSASLGRLNDIDVLQGVSNYQIWKRQFEDELTLLGMWHYIEDDYVAPAGATHAELKSWQQAHKRICTMLKSRCDENARAMIEDETNAQKAWKALEQNKPRGSGILNSTINKFESITLAGCNGDPHAYINLFRKTLREFHVLSSKFVYNQNHLIYRFHSGLGPVYSSYCEQYAQNHDPFDDDGKPKFTLDYAITDFIKTVTNPTNSTSSVETKALATLVNGTFAHNRLSVMALVATGSTEIKIQAGAHAGNSRTFTQTCKYCTHCKKDWHDKSECTTLHPHLKSRGGNGRWR